MRRPYYPRGKRRADDKGEVAMSFSIQDGHCIIAFEHATNWVGLPPDELESFIALLQGKLEELRKASGP